MRIINTGGTFNKIYDPIAGELVVPRDDRAIERILSAIHLKLPVVGAIYKDSLEMDDGDRAELTRLIEAADGDVVVVHGTDTMDRSADFVARRIQKRCVVFTGAMIPASIDPTEASANLTLAISKLLYDREPGVFIAMHGLVAPYEKIYKDRQKGVFCLR